METELLLSIRRITYGARVVSKHMRHSRCGPIETVIWPISAKGFQGRGRKAWRGERVRGRTRGGGN